LKAERENLDGRVEIYGFDEMKTRSSAYVGAIIPFPLAGKGKDRGI
jgi:hypothetical protein